MDYAKSLGQAEELEVRWTLLREPHVFPLTIFVEQMRAETGHGKDVPYFDPLDGGVNAECLLLLEAPGPRAAFGSGFVSRNNPDETAKNVFELCRDAGIARERTVLWNVVPWYIGSGTKIRAAKRKDIESGLPYLNVLITLLPRLKVIVLLGRKAERAGPALRQLPYALFRIPHPSPLVVNRLPENRGIILSGLRDVAAKLGTAGAAAVGS